MNISGSSDASLVNMRSNIADAVEVHSMSHQNGAMRMRAVGPLQIPAGKTVELAPNGMHLMLLGLKRPLKAGETLLLNMTFVDRNKRERSLVVDVPVRSVGQ